MRLRTSVYYSKWNYESISEFLIFHLKDLLGKKKSKEVLYILTIFKASEHANLYALILVPIKVYGSFVVGVNFLQCTMRETAPGTAVVHLRAPSRIVKTLKIEGPRQLTVIQDEPDMKQDFCVNLK